MPRHTPQSIIALGKNEPIVMLTAYDAPSARLADAAAEVVLVGDSVGTTVQGGPTTLGVTMDQMIYHTRIVSEHTSAALVVGDMPFMSYQASRASALRNAARFLKEGRAQAVKVEGATDHTLRSVEAMVQSGIPVMGHIGFTPQLVLETGAKVARDEPRLKRDMQALLDCGVFAVVLELVQSDIAGQLTEMARDGGLNRMPFIPTIGIGSGPQCTGQVLVFHDVLGFSPLSPEVRQPKFVKRYMDFHGQAAAALGRYRAEVKGRAYPDADHSHGPRPQ